MKLRVWMGLLVVLGSVGVLGQGLPNTAPFNKPVTLEASRALPLEAALRLIAQAAGVDLLVGAIPNNEVRGRISGPFHTVLDTLVSVYGGGQVGYQLVGRTVVVGPKVTLAAPPPAPEPAAPLLRYLGFAASGGRALGAVEVGGKVYLVRVGETIPGLQAQVVGLSPLVLEISLGNKRFRYPMGAGQEVQP